MATQIRPAVGGEQSDASRIAGELAERQGWAISRQQLLGKGVSAEQIRGKLRRGHLCSTSWPGVYAWGRPELSEKGELAAALLFAGKGSALGGLSALWWQGLLPKRPDLIHVAAPGRARSRAGISIRHPLSISRHLHEGIPVVDLAHALLTAAPSLSHNALRNVLARADFEKVLSLSSLHAACRKGPPGSKALRSAMSSHLPQLAHCVNPLEIDFVLLCEARRIPIPEPNPRIGRYVPDMLWREAMLIVELDGEDAHTSPAQLIADANRQRRLEARGYTVIRFSWEEVHLRPHYVADRVREALA